MLISMAWPWSNASNDALFNDGMQGVIDYVECKAKQGGLLNKYIYMNYASTGEAVIQSYGAQNVQFL